MATLLAPQNENYAAVIVQVDRIITLDNCDNVVSIPVLGYNAIVGKDTQVGDILVVFPPETQLSEAFASTNNLFRHENLNVDMSKKGYLEDNARVKAMKFRGHNSNALAMPLESLAQFTNTDDLKVGDVFDRLGETEICRKYVIPGKGGQQSVARITSKKYSRVDEKFMPVHFDTANYWRNADQIPGEAFVTITQKLHGTSIRFGRTTVKRTLTRREKIARFFGAKIATTEYDLVAGSRKVIKDMNNPDQNHFYKEDIWTQYAQMYGANLPDNVLIYGELIGWTPSGEPIQKNYTYNVPVGKAYLYIYRVTVITNDGHQFDLSWDAVKQFCEEQGFNHVPELWSGRHEDFVAEYWLDWNYSTMYPQAVPLSNEGTVDEGVCVRRECITPRVLKAKSPIFLGHETKMLDEEADDIESTA